MIRNILLALVAVVALAACNSFAVVTAESSGTGAVSTDGGKAVALGQISGELRARIKGSNAPIILPYEVSEGQVWTWTQNSGVTMYEVEDELPAWVDELLLPEEIEELGLNVAPE